LPEGFRGEPAEAGEWRRLREIVACLSEIASRKLVDSGGKVLIFQQGRFKRASSLAATT